MARGETYEEFTAKFEPKRTTDDCYTPPEVYDCVLRWAHREYGFDLAKVARPFYPGGDYEREDYPEGCTVVDNPPFSILSKIVKHYQERGVGFFLFAPTLTCMGIRNCCKVVTGVGVTYANGASVNTSFVTNLDPAQARSAPDLRSELDAAIERLRREKAKALPKYEYPDEVRTAPMLARYSKYGIDFRVGPQECSFTRALDAQRVQNKAIYGSGYLISERAAAERAAAERAAAERAAAERAAAERAAAERAAAERAAAERAAAERAAAERAAAERAAAERAAAERAAAERAAAERAAAERAAAERFALSPRERDVIASLG